MLTDLLKAFAVLFLLIFALSVYADFRGTWDSTEQAVAEWRAYPNDL